MSFGNIDDDEVLFPDATGTSAGQKEEKDIDNYEKATKAARNGKIGIFSVTREPDGQVTEVEAFLCNKKGNLVKVYCQLNRDPKASKIYEITGHDFLSGEGDDDLGLNISLDMNNQLAKTMSAIFKKER